MQFYPIDWEAHNNKVFQKLKEKCHLQNTQKLDRQNVCL